MTLRERLGRFLLRQAPPRGKDSLSALLFGSSESMSGASYERRSTQGYRRNPYGFAAVNMVGRAAAAVPWLLFSADTELESHPLLDLWERPNVRHSRQQFIRWLIGHLLVGGNAYIEATGPANQPPRELWLLRPNQVRIVAGERMGEVLRYEHDTGGTEPRRIPPGRILHLATFSPDSDDLGVAPFEAASESIWASNQARIWNSAQLGNSARPSGALQLQGSLSDQQRAQYKRELQQQYEGSRKAGTPLVLEGGMQWQQMSLDAEEMDWLEGSMLSAREIAVAAGVSPEQLGDPKTKTFASYREARKALYTETVLPYLDDLRDGLNAWLAPMYGEKLRLEYDRSQIEPLQSDRSELAAEIDSAVDLTLNERREARGYDSLGPAGDVLVIPMGVQLVRPGELAQPPPTPPTPPTTDPDDEPEGRAIGPQSIHLRAIGLQSDAERERHRRAMERFRSGRVEAGRLIVSRELRQTIAETAAAVRDGGSASVAGSSAESAIRARSDATLEVIRMEVWAPIGVAAARLVHGALEGRSVEVRQGELEDAWLDAVLTWLDSQVAGSLITQIDETTRLAILAQVRAGLDAGEGADGIADRIDGLALDPIIPRRSEVIARTETVRAANLGSQTAARLSGADLHKEWLPTPDERTRGRKPGDRFDHTHGQIRDLDEPYEVSGERLLYPGDTSLGASAGNVINCRCAEAYLLR